MKVRGFLQIALPAAALAVGCAAPARPPASPAGDGHVTVVTDRSFRQYRLEGNELSDPITNVSFLDDGYRGVYRHQQIVDLFRVGAREIRGTVGGWPADLFVDEVPGGLLVRGVFRGRRRALALTPERLQIGPCAYGRVPDGAGDAYVADDSCGARVAGTRLTLPEGFDRRPTADRAVTLALLFL
jgi:hypothetical protein